MSSDTWTLSQRAEEIKKTAIEQELDVYDARRGILEFAQQYGFTKEQSYYLITAMTELGNNIVFHSLGGCLSLQLLSACHNDRGTRQVVGLQIFAEDTGPGIDDIQLALQDGFTTANSMGCGLSGVERLMDDLHITSTPAGTQVTARIWLNEFRGLFCLKSQ